LILPLGAAQITISQSVWFVFRSYAVRYRELVRLDMEKITSDIRGWAAEHPSGTAEDAVTDLGLPYPRDMVIIARSVLFVFRESAGPEEKTS
jgi:hypothetical protein